MKFKRGVSPAVATILLISVTLAAAGTLYYLVSDAQRTRDQGEAAIPQDLRIETCTYNGLDTRLYVRNPESKAIDTGYINGLIRGNLSKYFVAGREVVNPSETFIVQLNHQLLDEKQVTLRAEKIEENYLCRPEREYSEPHNSAPDCSTDTYRGSGTDSDPYLITNDWQLQCTNQTLNTEVHYALTDNIDATGTEEWHNGSGFIPIGNSGRSSGNCNAPPYNGFEGSFDGRNHVIKGLHLNHTKRTTNGLFGFAESARIGNLTLEGGKNFGSSGFSGGYGCTGGLVGHTTGELDISNVASSMDVEDTTSGSVATGGIGGFIQGPSEITESYVDAKIDGNNLVGGITGISSGVEIRRSYFSGALKGVNSVGGITGMAWLGGNLIENSYSRGRIVGNDEVGGLIGANGVGFAENNISKSFSAAKISGNNYVGGIAGKNGASSIINQTYWDVEATGQNSVTGTNSGTVVNADGFLTESMQGEEAVENMQALDFEKTWITREISDYYPFLSWRVKQNG